MTRAQFEVVLEMAVYNSLWKVIKAAPKDTGNLAYNAVKLRRTKKGYTISVSSSVAPYMPYTEEPWISPYWNGKKNPNEGWFKQVAQDVAEYIRQVFNGERADEVNRWIENLEVEQND